MGTLLAKVLDPSEPRPDAPEVGVRVVRMVPLYFARIYGRERLEAVWRQAKLPLPLSYLDNRNSFVSLRFLEHMVQVLADAADDRPAFIKNSARHTISPESLGFVYYLLKGFGTPAYCYQRTVELGTSYNRVGQHSIERLGKNEVVIKYVSSQPEQNRNICLIRQAQWEAIPTIWGLRSEVKELECQVTGGSACRYHVRWEKKVQGWRRYAGMAGGLAAGWVMHHYQVAFGAYLLPATGFLLGGWLDANRRNVLDRERLDVQSKGLMQSMRDLGQQYEDLQKAKREVEAINLELEKRVLDRTKDLEEAVVAQKAALQRLQDSEERLSTTLNSIGDGVIAADVNARIIRMNPAAEALTGWTLAEAVGETLGSVVRMTDKGSTMQEDLAGRVMKEGRVVGGRGVQTLFARDGTQHSVAARAAPIREGSEVAGVVVVLRDVTEEKALEQRVVFSERMASIGTMASGVAHEINNPLAYVVANLSYVSGSLDNLSGPPELLQDLRAALSDAQDGADRVRIIVHDLKAFARPENEQVEEVDLEQVLNSALSMAASEIRHRAKLTKDFQDSPTVLGNSAKLGQVFLNLLVNAAQAVPDGRANDNVIGVTLYTDERARAVVKITDTGAGIADSMRQRIFDPFFTTKPVGEGTGLGLSVSHAIVTSLGGEILVDSEVGRGSTFTVVLPAAPRVIRRAKPLAPATAKPTNVQGLRILLIDDEELVTASMRRCLEPMHRVTIETSAEAALERLVGGEEFDVICSDLMMPQMSGMDFYQAVMAKKPELLPKLVFMTGGAFTASARSFLATVPNKCLEKPFSPDALRAMVALLVKAPSDS